MPTVVTDGPFRIRVLNPPREHRPAHVHVVTGKAKGGSEVLINLGEPEVPGGPWGSVSLREVKGMRARDVMAAVRLVETHVVTLREEWERIHGKHR